MTGALAAQPEYRPADDLSWRNVAGDLVVLNTRSAEYHTFNEIGRIVWLAIADGNRIDEIVQLVLDEYAANEATVVSDVDELVGRLVECGLLEKVHSEERGENE